MPEIKDSCSEDFISTSKEINVEEIIDSIKKKIKEKNEAGILKQKDIDEINDMELLPLPDFLEIPNVYEPHLYPKHKVEGFEPFHLDLEVETGTAKKILGKIRKIISPFTRFMIRPFVNDLKNLQVELHNQDIEEIHRLKQLIPIVFQSKEYIKLLHNFMNNMIVELSKLKIEEELLKTKIKVMEDKVEFLENRERAVEKKLFKE